MGKSTPIPSHAVKERPTFGNSARRKGDNKNHGFFFGGGNKLLVIKGEVARHSELNRFPCNIAVRYDSGLADYVV